MPSPSPRQGNFSCIAMLVTGLFLFALQDIVVKSFADRYSVLQIVCIRGLVALLPMACLAWLTLRRRTVRVRRWDLLLLRGLLGLLSFLGYYLAIAAMPLTQAVTVVFTAPIFATALSAMLLGEPVGVRRWIAVVVGFAAVVLVVGPAGHLASLGTLLALGAALTYAGQTLITRQVGDSVPASLTSLVAMGVFVAGSALASLLLPLLGLGGGGEDPSLQFLLRPWTVPDNTDLVLMLLLGVNAALGFYLLTRAYASAPVSAVAPFEYSYIIWAVLFGYLIWDEVPSPTTLAGVVLMIASSLYILHRELRAGGEEARLARRTVPAESDLLVKPLPEAPGEVVQAPAPARTPAPAER